MDDRTNVGMRLSGTPLWWPKAIVWSLVAIFLCSGCGAPTDAPSGPQTAPAPVEQLSPDRAQRRHPLRSSRGQAGPGDGDW